VDEKPRLEILNDPVYGPNSPFFWPGTVLHAKEFVFCDTLDCRSTKDFLEDYKYDYSDVEVYIENTEYPKEEYVDQLYAHFHKLYDGIESWPYHTFVVSAFYRIVFHQTFPYQSKLYQVTKSSSFDDLNRLYISEGLYDKAITSVTLQSLQQDKEIDKVGGRISKKTWYHLTKMLLNPTLDFLVYKEVTRLLKQYNLVDAYPEDFKKEILLTFKLFFMVRGCRLYLIQKHLKHL
jgi:hypothetical protein